MVPGINLEPEGLNKCTVGRTYNTYIHSNRSHVNVSLLGLDPIIAQYSHMYMLRQDMQLTNLMYRGPLLEAYLLAGILDPPHHTLSMREEEDTSSYKTICIWQGEIWQRAQIKIKLLETFKMKCLLQHIAFQSTPNLQLRFSNRFPFRNCLKWWGIYHGAVYHWSCVYWHPMPTQDVEGWKRTY